GQNPPLTLLFLIWGWALIVRDRPTAAGVVWGLLAFKPVWALAFFLVPFLTGRWRTCLAMLLTAGFLVVLTLPFVGFYS
ncbi:glycosyltransferase 87 family protein, partial [Acinetobacter baumannii]